MFTVVIAEQEHLNSIKEYQAFLKPFTDNESIAFCGWDMDGRNLVEAVPELAATVQRHTQWRLIVLCDEEGIHQKNPFDRVPYTAPERREEMTDREYWQAVTQAKCEAYERAATKPLVRLMTWLCQSPMVSDEICYNSDDEDADHEYGAYLTQIRAKNALRKVIAADIKPDIALPCEVICVAKRTASVEQYDIQKAWEVHQELEYSRFYDWNMYFDKMRYLIFDILPWNHRNYTFDYIRFLYAVMVLAENDVPMGSLNPNRVYVMNCRNDESALTKLLGRYDAKLAATQDQIRKKMEELANTVYPRLTDREAAAIYGTGMTVPVNTPRDFDMGTLFVSDGKLGMAADCPESERSRWINGYKNSRKALTEYLRIPKRALKRAISDLRRMNTVDLEKAAGLNAFQLEDIEENIREQERKMNELKLCNVYDMDGYIEKMEEQNKKVEAVLKKRMTKKWTVTLGLLALGCYLIGFLPMFISNLKAENGTLFSLIFVAAGAAVMALAGLGALVVLKWPVKKAIRDYNGIMKEVVEDVEASMARYSAYLSHCGNVMRGNTVLNYCRKQKYPEHAKWQVLRKHETDICAVRKELREIFGVFMPPEGEKPEVSEQYNYDFSRSVDFSYPIPFEKGMRKSIEFMQQGHTVEVPVDFVQQVTVRRENLYD